MMTAKDYQKIKDKLGWSHPVMGEKLGISRRCSQRYAYGKAPIPKAIAIVLKLVNAGTLDPEAL